LGLIAREEGRLRVSPSVVGFNRKQRTRDIGEGEGENILLASAMWGRASRGGMGGLHRSQRRQLAIR